jgi:hypothetical protein
LILARGAKIVYIMPDEAETRSAEAPHRGRHSRGSRSDSSPLQTRAAFIKNWDWQSVISINRGACERGRAQHGINSETGAACASDWEEKRQTDFSLLEVIDLLQSFHRRAPFLFFNGNTFAAIGRQMALTLFGDLPPTRKREVGSAIAHCIAGVLDRESMVDIVEGLCERADWKAGDRVKTIRGSLRGKIVRLLQDGRVLWRPDGGQTELIALPETLLRD